VCGHVVAPFGLPVVDVDECLLLEGEFEGLGEGLLLTFVRFHRPRTWTWSLCLSKIINFGRGCARLWGLTGGGGFGEGGRV
jgi:hypothetical protein